MKRGVITLVFDDGYRHILENIVPLLDRYHIPAVFAVPLDHNITQSIERLSTARYQEWLPLITRGHEIAAHSASHTDLTRLDDEALSRELSLPAAALGASTLVYPGGAHDDRVITFAQSHYSACRTVARGLETLPPHDPMRLRTFNWSKRNFSLWKANLLALWALVTNRWLIETYHIVSQTQHDQAHTVSLDDFEKHLRFLSRLPIHKSTIQTICSPLSS